MKLTPVILVILIIISVALYINWQKGLTKSPSTLQTVNNGLTVGDITSPFIESMRKRQYTGGEIKIEETLSSEGNYTSYIFS